MMKITARMILYGVMLFSLAAGCSSEDKPPPPKPPKVVKPIVQPPPPSEADASPSLMEGETDLREVSAPVEAETKGMEGKPQEISKAASLEGSPGASETGVAAKTPRETPVAAPPEKPAELDKEAGVYVVKQGQSLAEIAKDEAVYGDPLKWPLLYRLNRDKLGNTPAGEDFPNRGLTGGLRLKIAMPEEAGEHREGRDGHVWVVNILSATTNKRIVPAALKLIQLGYPVYITTARVKGKDWMRLRLGFFEGKKEADEKGKTIKALLNEEDSWSTRASKQEIEAYRGY